MPKNSALGILNQELPRYYQPVFIEMGLAAPQEKGFEPDFRLKMDLEAQSRGLDKAPPPEPSSRSMPSPDNVWQRPCCVAML